MHRSELNLLVILLLILTFLFGTIGYYTKGTADTVTFIVKDKEKVVTGRGESIRSKYLIFTEEETFENTDTFWYFKFNSSDIQGKLEKNKKYTAKVYGFRVPFFSIYRNIVSLEEKVE